MNPLIPTEGGTYHVQSGALVRSRVANADLSTIRPPTSETEAEQK